MRSGELSGEFMKWNTVERAIKTETDTRTEWKGVGKLGWSCQKRRLQHPHHMEMSPWGLLKFVPNGMQDSYGFDKDANANIKQPSLPTPPCPVLVSVSVLMALSTVLHSINSHDHCPPSHSVLLVLCLPYWSFQLFISLRKSPSALNPLWATGLKTPNN